MYGFILVLVTIVCILLILIVLVQNSKGGGLASNFSAANQVMGVRRSTDFLEKATWTFATALLLLSLIASISVKRGERSQDSRLDGSTQEIYDPANPIDFDPDAKPVAPPADDRPPADE